MDDRTNGQKTDDETDDGMDRWKGRPPKDIIEVDEMHLDDLLWHISIDSIMLKTNGSKLSHEHGIRARIWNLKKPLPLKQVKFKQFISSPMDEC